MDVGEDLHLDLNGKDVQPETLDATASLALALALLEAVVAIGEYEDESGEAPFFLAMTKMESGSVHLAFSPAPKATHAVHPFAAFQHAAKRLPVYLRGYEGIPKELTKPLERLRQTARAMPANVNAQVRCFDETVSLSELATPEVQLITTAETVRALIMRAGGSRPRVTLRVRGQKDFTANIAREQVSADNFRIYREADVTGIFRRDPRAIGNPIVSGDVSDLRLATKVDPVAAFDAWYEACGRPWKDVHDIAQELRGRGRH